MNALTKHTSIFSATTLLFAAAFAAPAMASSTSLSRAATAKTTITSGIVISKDVRRHTLVVTSASGVVQTVRLSSRMLAKARVGEKVTGRTSRLADGTYAAAVMTSVGHATRARIRATIVSSRSGKLLLSAGGSVFTVSSGRSAHAQSVSTVDTGQTVDVSVGIAANGLDQISEHSTGQSNLIGLDGVLTAVSPLSLTIAVEGGALTTVALPAGLTIPTTIAVGDRVEIMVDYANQSFSLVTIKDDSVASNNQGDGVSIGDNQNLQVEGQVVAVSLTSLTIQPGDQAAAVTFNVPTTVDVSAVLVGDQVDAEGLVVAGALTLTTIDVQQNDNQGTGDQATSQVTGAITALSATSVSVSLTGSSVVITAAIPSTLDASKLVLGATVRLSTEVVAGVLTVTDVEVPDAYSVDVSGTVVSMSATTLIVLSSDTQLPTTFTIPTSLNVPAVAVGLTVTAHGDLVAGVAVLTSLELAS